MQWAASALARALAIERVGNGAGVRVQLQDTREIEPLVDDANAAQVDVDEFARRQVARCHHSLKPGNRRTRDLVVDVDAGNFIAGVCRCGGL